MKKLLALAVLLLAGCGEPAKILKEEQIELTIVEYVHTPSEHGFRYTSESKLEVTFDNGFQTNLIYGYDCEITDKIIGKKIILTKSIDEKFIVAYNTSRESVAELMLDICW